MRLADRGCCATGGGAEVRTPLWSAQFSAGGFVAHRSVCAMCWVLVVELVGVAAYWGGELGKAAGFWEEGIME